MNPHYVLGDKNNVKKVVNMKSVPGVSKEEGRGSPYLPPPTPCLEPEPGKWKVKDDDQTTPNTDNMNIMSKCKT